MSITVCSACLQASCWQGEFTCRECKGAGTVEKTLDELRALDREHPQWWDIDPNTGRAKHLIKAERQGRL